MTCRPAGPVASGSRMIRQAARHRSSGTSQATMPTEPATTVRTPWPRSPGSCHHTAAAVTTAVPTRNSPRPSRRCAGSSSRAWWPTERTSAPTACESASQAAATARPSTAKRRKTGPGPLRTARGAGRRVDDVAFDDLDAGFFVEVLPEDLPDEDVLDRLPDDRDRELDVPDPLDPEVVLLRDAGGEDVRVAMVRTLGEITRATRLTRRGARQRSSWPREGRPDVRGAPWRTVACRAPAASVSSAHPGPHRTT